MREITVKDYSELKGCTLKTVYERIKKGVLPQRVKEGKKYVLVDEAEYNEWFQSESNFTDLHEVKEQGEDGKNTYSEYIEDVEIVQDLPSEQKYNLISMENTTFERLIQDIKEIAEARVESEKESRSKIESEYFEVKAESKRLNEEAQRFKIESIQWEAEYKILQVKVKEVEGKSEELSKKLEKYEKQIEQLIFDKKSLEEKLTGTEKHLLEKTQLIEEIKNNLQEKAKEIKDLRDCDLKNDELIRELNEVKRSFNEVKKENSELKEELKNKVNALEKLNSSWFARVFKS